jgi:hypothetical protein
METSLCCALAFIILPEVMAKNWHWKSKRNNIGCIGAVKLVVKLPTFETFFFFVTVAAENNKLGRSSLASFFRLA